MKKKVLLVEFNEFNRELLKDCAALYGLENIQRLLSLEHSDTVTKDTYESDFLEPWVQWVNVHTGLESKEHQIKHLGDVPRLDCKQLWEALSEKGITSAVWGAMNASKGQADQCLFFLPDPWTFSEKAYPEEVNSLLNPLRYIAKNYLSRSYLSLFSQFSALLKWIKKERLSLSFLATILKMAKSAILHKAEHFTFISHLEAFSADVFFRMKKKYDPDFSVLFINSLAHVQHHHWKDFNYLQNEKLKFSLTIVDEIFGKIFSEMQENELLICFNALSQMNTGHEKPWILYRQYDQKKFLNAIGLNRCQVEPHMTHDAHLFFETEKDLKEGVEILRSAKVNGKSFFHVETYQDEPKKAFYKVIFTDELFQDPEFKIAGKSINFFEFFKPVVTRTGRHIPYGTLFTNAKSFPKKLANHEVYHEILKLLTVS
jgi:hypothetical protein